MEKKKICDKKENGAMCGCDCSDVSNSRLIGVLDGVTVNREDLENLIHYADVVAKILKDAGYEGKATALEDRYMKIADSIAMGGRNHET